MKTEKDKIFHGSVCDLKEGDRIDDGKRFWIVGKMLKPFDSFTIRVTITPEKNLLELKNGEYTTKTFGKEVIL